MTWYDHEDLKHPDDKSERYKVAFPSQYNALEVLDAKKREAKRKKARVLEEKYARILQKKFNQIFYSELPLLLEAMLVRRLSVRDLRGVGDKTLRMMLNAGKAIENESSCYDLSTPEALLLFLLERLALEDTDSFPEDPNGNDTLLYFNSKLAMAIRDIAAI